jgi:hypothetical protein
VARSRDGRLSAKHAFDARTGAIVVDVVVEGLAAPVRLTAEAARAHAAEVERLAAEALAARRVAVVEVDASCESVDGWHAAYDGLRGEDGRVCLLEVQLVSADG